MAADLQSAVVDHCTTLQFFFCFVEKSRIELLTTKFSVWHSTTELLLHFFLLPHKDSNLDNNGSEPFALPLCYKAIIAESHGFEPYALPRTFGLANQPNSLSVALSKDGRKVESTIPRRFTVPAVFKTVLAYHTS